MKAPADGRKYYIIITINGRQEMAYKDKRGVVFRLNPKAKEPYTPSRKAYKRDYTFVRGCSGFDF